MANAYQYRMPAGIPGEVSRLWDAVIEPAAITPYGTTGHPTAYGVPLVPDSASGNEGNMRILAAGDTYVYGVLVRPFPTGASQDALGVSTPPLNGACDVLRSGYITVLLSGSTDAVKGGQVYVWTAAATGTHIVGGWESTDPSSNGFAVTGARFMGPAGAGNIVEIAIYP